MIYTLGCSLVKWYWPTWADWLEVYGQPVTNLGYNGYCNNQMYWILVDRIKDLKKDDHVIIMWPHTFRIVNWYDREWVDENDVLGFFPKTNGKLWFTKNTPYMGMYRLHPDRLVSLSHGIIEAFNTILQTQMLLDSVGCTYTMTYSQNLWVDARPTYKPTFKTRWNELTQLSDKELSLAKQLLELDPLRNILERIKWETVIDAPTNLDDISQYAGLWEYFLREKEYVMYKHDSSNHPPAIAHHDWAVEKILKLDPKTAKHRQTAKQISFDAMSMPIPEFSEQDYVADPATPLLDSRFKDILEKIKD